jgi:hypothetical protein
MQSETVRFCQKCGIRENPKFILQFFSKFWASTLSIIDDTKKIVKNEL